jgi:isopentenyl-diphosphate Delta-isomerase
MVRNVRDAKFDSLEALFAMKKIRDHHIVTQPPTTQPILKDAIDALDEQGYPTGEVLSRKEIHRLGKLHRAIHLYLFDQSNNLLLQKRSAQVDHYPNMFSISVTGHVDAGENSWEAVVRELQEELGLDPKKGTDRVFIFTKTGCSIGSDVYRSPDK